MCCCVFRAVLSDAVPVSQSGPASVGRHGSGVVVMRPAMLSLLSSVIGRSAATGSPCVDLIVSDRVETLPVVQAGRYSLAGAWDRQLLVLATNPRLWPSEHTRSTAMMQ